MAKPRKRFDDAGKPMPCSVVIPPELAAHLYDAKREGAYRDETELVNAIVRTWAFERQKQKPAPLQSA